MQSSTNVPVFRTGNPFLDVWLNATTAMVQAQRRALDRVGERSTLRAERIEDRRNQDTEEHSIAREGVVIPVLKEELHVGKRTLETRGTVRVVKSIVEREVSVPVRLMHEKVIIERRAVSSAPVDDEADFHNGTIEVRELREVPVVEKYLTKAEEIVIRKSRQEHTETVRERVREMRVNVQQPTEEIEVEEEEPQQLEAAGNKPLNARERRRRRRRRGQ